MSLVTKKSIASVIVALLLIALLSFVYTSQIERNYDAKNESYKDQIQELEKENKRLEDNNDCLLENNEYLKKQYKKYFELCEELENQIGVYYE